MMTSFGPPRKSNPNISERITKACVELESLLNRLEPCIVIRQHLPSLKQALFHSHTKVVQVAVKQLVRLANDKEFVEQLSEDMEVVLGVIENLAHKDQRVAKDCVKVLLLLSSSSKALLQLLCPDVTNVIKTIMTYVAVRLLVYEFIMQLSINSPLGLEKSHTCGILEDVINDFKKKESYLTDVHYYQLHNLAETSHGRSYLVKYDAADCVTKQPPEVTSEFVTHLITVVPADVTVVATPPTTSTDVINSEYIQPYNQNYELKNCHQLKSLHSRTHPLILNTLRPSFFDQNELQQIPNSPSSIGDFSEQDISHAEKCSTSLREVQLTSSSSSLSSPCDSLDSSTVGRKQDDIKDMVSDSSSHADRSFTPPLHSSTTTTDTSQEQFVLVLTKAVSSMKSVAPYELFNHYPDLLDTVLKALDSSHRHTILLALQVVGYVGSAIEGKRLLYKQSKKEKFMAVVMRKLLSTLIHSSAEQRAQAVDIFYNLINVSGSNVKYEKITRKWFRLMGRPQEIMKVISMLCQQPSEVIQVSTYRLVWCLCRQEWSQNYIRGRKGFLDMVLNESHNESQIVREVKNSALEALLESPTAGTTFKSHTLDRIHNFLYKFKEV